MLKLAGITHKYPRQDDFILDNINLEINQGDHIVIAGKNGSGKSTLANILTGIITPQSGNISFQPDKEPVIAYVQQHPENQVIASTVELEIAFGLENQVLAASEIRQRVDAVLKKTGLEELRFRNPAKLSGGEMQRVAFAVALALNPDFWVLDEPTAYLDPEQVDNIRTLIQDLDNQTTWIWIASNPAEYFLGNKLAILDKGKLSLFTKENFSKINFEEYSLKFPQKSHFEILTSIKTENHNAAEIKASLNCRRNEIVENISEFKMQKTTLQDYLQLSLSKIVKEKIFLENSWQLSVKNLSASRNEFLGATKEVLQNITLNISSGSITAIVGKSGSGKSTLLESITGLLKSVDGDISWGGTRANKLYGRIGVAFQFPERSFFAETVLDEIAFGPRNLGMNKKDSLDLAGQALEKVGLDAAIIGSQNPLTLSVGQSRRVTLAVTWALRPIAWLLDEPTSGLDPEGCDIVKRVLLEEAKNGALILIAGHDYDTFLELTDNWIFLEDGKIQKQGNVFELINIEDKM